MRRHAEQAPSRKAAPGSLAFKLNDEYSKTKSTLLFKSFTVNLGRQIESDQKLTKDAILST